MLNKLKLWVRQRSWVLLALILLAAGLRFYRIDAQSLWYDEGNSARIAERSVRLIIEGAAGDIHPPLYYLLLKLWRTMFGSSELALRGLSAVCGIATVAFTYLMGREWFNRRTALFAALMVALSPFAIYYSQETRMYALLALAAAASTWALTPVLKEPRWSIGRMTIYVVATSVGLYTQYAYPFVMLAQGVCFGLAYGRRLWGNGLARYVSANVVALGLFGPWLPIALRQIRGWSVAAQPYEFWSALLECLRWITLGRTLPQTEATMPMLLYAALGLLAFVAVRAKSTDDHAHLKFAWYALVLLALPLALLFAFNLYRDAYLKFLVVCVPPLALLVGRGMDLVASAKLKVESGGPEVTSSKFKVQSGLIKAKQLVLILLSTFNFQLSTFYFLLLTLLPFASLRNLYFNPAYARDDYRGIAWQLQTGGQPDDAILLLAPNQWEVFTYYWPDISKTFPLTYRPLNEAAVDRQMRAIVAGRRRLFVLYYAEREADQNGWYQRWLAEHAFKADQQWVGNIRLAIYHAPTVLPDSLTLQNSVFGGKILLTHTQMPNAPHTQVQVGEVLPLLLHWQALEKIEPIYKVFVHIGLADGTPVAQNDGEPVDGWRATPHWNSGDVIDDPRAVWIKPGTPPGRYSIFVGLYNAATGQRLNLPNGSDRLYVGEIEIVDRPQP